MMYRWPEENEEGLYDEGTEWVCCSCGYSKRISKEDMDPRACNRCGGPTCIDCWTDIAYCSRCEEATRDEA